MTHVIDWQGKIGYGDFISPISFAHNQSIKRDQDVVLKFHWKADSPENTKYDPENDPESAYERVNILFDYIKPNRVKLEHHFNSVVPGGGPHTNYNIDTNNYNDIYHNIVMRDIEIEDKPKINNVVICDGSRNKEQFPQWKQWKNHLSKQEWLIVWNECSRREADVEYVSYKTPLKEMIETISNADLFIGYHGSASWVARMVQVPMVVFTNNTSFSQWVFPWASCRSNTNAFNIYNARAHSQANHNTIALLMHEAYLSRKI